MISSRQFFQSLRHALRGVCVVFQTEQSFRLQAIAAAVALGLGAGLRVSRVEFVALLASSAAVLTLELVNSIFERLVDAFKPRLHPLVQDVKDIMAATVLLAAVFATAIGAVIFLPRFAALVFAS